MPSRCPHCLSTILGYMRTCPMCGEDTRTVSVEELADDIQWYPQRKRRSIKKRIPKVDKKGTLETDEDEDM